MAKTRKDNGNLDEIEGRLFVSDIEDDFSKG